MKTKSVQFFMKMLLTFFPFISLQSQHVSGETKERVRSQFSAAQNLGIMLHPTAAVGTVKIPEAYMQEKILRNFYKRYKVKQAPDWYHLDKRTFLADFTHEGIKIKAFFSRRGPLLYAMRYSNAASLPKGVYQSVRSTYFDHKIGVVTEVQLNGRSIWVVNLEGESDYLTIRVEDNSIEQVKSYQKQQQEINQRKHVFAKSE